MGDFDDTNNTATHYNIGNILLMRAGVSADQIAEALRRQKKDPSKRLGEILIDMHAIDKETLTAALSTQSRWRQKGPNRQDVANLATTASEGNQSLMDALDDLDALLGKDEP